MSTFKVFKETSLPATLQPNAIYFITSASDANLLEMYVTNTDASTPHRHVITKAEIDALITTKLQAFTELAIVANITARNALSPTISKYVYVTDATGDATVKAGGATYLYNTTNSTWLKVSEAESMDVTATWASLTGKPTSLVTDIDDAVTKRHAHANKTQLDSIGQNVAGELTYGGVQVKTEWSTTAW